MSPIQAVLMCADVTAVHLRSILTKTSLRRVILIEALIIKVGSVPIGVGAGDLACNALACSGYFSIECPPPGMKSSRGAAVLAGCNACSQGRFISKVS